jgi:hypothetical protein
MRLRLDERIGPNGETREWLILASIRAGGYPHVAAQAYGVPQQEFLHWLRRGGVKRGPRTVRRLVALAHEAAARARLKAEMTVYDADPRFWLRHGPGKETRHAPGWSALAKPVSDTGDSGKDLLNSPEIQAALAAVMGALHDLPEARVAVAQALDALDRST